MTGEVEEAELDLGMLGIPALSFESSESEVLRSMLLPAASLLPFL